MTIANPWLLLDREFDDGAIFNEYRVKQQQRFQHHLQAGGMLLVQAE